MKKIETDFGVVLLDDEDYVRLQESDYSELKLIKGRVSVCWGKEKQVLSKFVLRKEKSNRDKTTLIDNNPLNCTKKNIALNGYKRGKAGTQKSKYIGVVTKSKSGLYYVRIPCITKKGRAKHVGVYKNEIVAAIAYNKAMKMYYAGFRYRPNVINISKSEYDKIYKELNINIVPKTNRQGVNRKNKNTTSKYTGVCWSKSKNKWESKTYYKGINILVGRFDNEIEAAQAYNATVLFLYGVNSKINPVPEPLHPIVDLEKIRHKLEKKGIKV